MPDARLERTRHAYRSRPVLPPRFPPAVYRRVTDRNGFTYYEYDAEATCQALLWRLLVDDVRD